MVFAIHQCESAISIYVSPPSWTPLPLPSLPHPSRLSESNSFGCPESYIKLTLVIYFTYGNVYVSTLFSQIILPHRLQLSPRVCSLCLCLFCCPACRTVCTIFPDAISSVQFSPSVVSNFCHPMNRSMPGLPVHHQLPEFTQTHVHWVGDAIQPSHPLSSPSPPAPSLSQHQSLFQWVNSSHEVAKVLEFQLQHQSFQWTPKDWSPLGWIGWISLQSKGLSRVFSNTTV